MLYTTRIELVHQLLIKGKVQYFLNEVVLDTFAELIYFLEETGVAHFQFGGTDRCNTTETKPCCKKGC